MVADEQSEKNERENRQREK